MIQPHCTHVRHGLCFDHIGFSDGWVTWFPLSDGLSTLRCRLWYDTVVSEHLCSFYASWRICIWDYAFACTALNADRHIHSLVRLPSWNDQCRSPKGEADASTVTQGFLDFYGGDFSRHTALDQEQFGWFGDWPGLPATNWLPITVLCPLKSLKTLPE